MYKGWMDSETALRFDTIEQELINLRKVHSELLGKLRETNSANRDQDSKQLVDINKKIGFLEKEKEKIAKENPILPQNINKYLNK